MPSRIPCLLYFFDFILEAFQCFERAFMNDNVIAQQANLGAALDQPDP
jgi:hypothetical protein